MKTILSLILFTAASTFRPDVQAAETKAVEIPPGLTLISKLAPHHPRLLVSAESFEKLNQRIRQDAALETWFRKIQADGRRILAQSPSRYEIPDGLRLLSTSRRVLSRIYTLGLLYRLEPNPAYRDRAWQELEAAAGFPDWNPRHFLDTAEMTHAFAIAYDWLFGAWTAEQRATLRQAIINQGLQPALASYRGTQSYGWWTKARHNWNQVCNGGIGMGALAIGDETPELAGEILEAALKSLPLAMAEFAPDGAWREGPGYWNYATSYNVVFLAALETALGTDFGLSDFVGFGETGLFPIYLTGPLERTFNYADGGDQTIRAPQMFWLAQRFQKPAFAAYQRAVASPAPLDLVWGSEVGEAAIDLPLDRYFRGAEVATLRSGWNDHDALFVGLKGGDNKANHSNLDLGSFVFDALGKRWAMDLGADNYNLPGYFGNQRWTYYRMRAEGHNTLVLNPGSNPDQDPRAAARIESLSSSPDAAQAIVNLTAAYAANARSVRRGFALIRRRQFLIQDEIEASQPADVWWFLHTPASIEVGEGGRTAILSQDGARLVARVLSPGGARFEAMEAAPLPSSPNPEGQRRNNGVRKLAVHLEDTSQARLAVVLMSPEQSERIEGIPIRPLAEW